VLGLTDSAGAVVATYRYDAWGNILEAEGPLAAVNPYRYASYRWLDHLGLYFLQARFYDAAGGRFLSRDVLLGYPKHIATLNLYSYVAGNPVSQVDPTGSNYIDINLTLTFWKGVSMGVMYDYRQRQYYGYAGIATGPPGASLSATYSTANASRGLIVSASGTAIGAVQVGVAQDGSLFAEGGLGLGVGFSTSVVYATPIRLTAGSARPTTRSSTALRAR